MTALLGPFRTRRVTDGAVALPVSIARDHDGVDVQFQWIDPNDLAEPFFFEAGERQGGSRWIVRIDRADIPNLPVAPAALGGLIFHVGRCGSTLVSQALKLGAPVFSEPEALANLLLPPFGSWRKSELTALTRWVLGCYAQAAPGRAIVKLTSWLVLFSDIIETAAPGTPSVFVHRDPGDVARSMMAQPPGWAKAWLPAALANGATLNRDRRLAELLGAFLKSGADLDALLLDYRDLKPKGIERAFAHFGIELDTATRETLRSVMETDAKALDSALFQPNKITAPLDATLAVEIASHATPAYFALTQRDVGEGYGRHPRRQKAPLNAV